MMAGEKCIRRKGGGKAGKAYCLVRKVGNKQLRIEEALGGRCRAACVSKNSMGSHNVNLFNQGPIGEELCAVFRTMK